MEHNGPAEAVQKQQVKKKLNALTPTKEDNSEIIINDLDTRFCITEKLSNGQKDSKPDNDSDSIFQFSGDVIKHSVNKNSESSNIDCGKSDSDVPTAVTENDDIENSRKVAAMVRKVLRNETRITNEKMEWPLCLLNESKQSVKISQQDLHNIVINKATEVMATRSYYGKQMINVSVCKEQQRSYYRKYKQLLKYISTINSDLELMNRKPDNVVYNVRNVGTSVNMPGRKKTL